MEATATPVDTQEAEATTPVVADLQAATPAAAESAGVVVAATAAEEAAAHHPAAALLQEAVLQQAAAVAADTTRPNQQSYDRCATGCGPGLGIGRPVSTRVCSRVTRILHPSGSTTPPHVLSRTPIHATWSGPIIHAVALVL